MARMKKMGMETPKEEAKEEMARKRGGKVHGGKGMKRPDKRARGGATSDSDPMTTASKMTVMPFERKQAPSPNGVGTAMEKASD